MCPPCLFLHSFFFFFLLPPPLFLASGVPMLLIRPYQWSNLAATAWVSVARRVVPLSCPAVAEINPQIEQSLSWPLQTPKSRSVHPFNRDSLCLKLFSSGCGGGRMSVCACVWKSESLWGQGGLSEHEMDRGEGLSWLTEPVYISNDTLLWEGGWRGKSAPQAKHSGVHFSVSFSLREKDFVCYILWPSCPQGSTRDMIFFPPV